MEALTKESIALSSLRADEAEGAKDRERDLSGKVSDLEHRLAVAKSLLSLHETEISAVSDNRHRDQEREREREERAQEKTRDAAERAKLVDQLKHARESSKKLQLKVKINNLAFIFCMILILCCIFNLNLNSGTRFGRQDLARGANAEEEGHSRCGMRKMRWNEKIAH